VNSEETLHLHEPCERLPTRAREPGAVGLAEIAAPMRLLDSSSTTAVPNAAWSLPSLEPQTASRVSLNTGYVPLERRSLPPSPTKLPLARFRRISGLTWDEIAQIFGLPRQDIDAWVSGQPPSLPQSERFYRLYEAINHVDRGAADANRRALFTLHSGVVPFQLLVADDCQTFKSLLGPGRGRRAASSASKTKETRQTGEAYAPPPPEALANARPENLHIPKIARLIKRISVPRKGRSER
jgi:hypothetical protein